jgi:2-polyprenyl-6-methoxyphenol hydroxylase-like FAD-dependent oxidoreductase
MSAPRIVIIGAGIAGLALAQGLRKRNISFSVHERDDCLDSRSQGNRIKILGELKQKLVELLPPEVWTILEETCASTSVGETNLRASDASVTACRRGRLPPGVSPPLTADRGLLRHALMTGINDCVHFGQQFERYELIEEDQNSSDCVRVFFADGSATTATLLVGVDGSQSRVRQQLIPGPSYIIDTATCCVYGKSPLTTELQERFPAPHRRWLTVVRDEAPFTQSIISGDGPVVMVLEACHFLNRDIHHHLPEDYVHWGILFHKGLLRLNNDKLDAVLQDAPKLALDLTAEWNPSIRSLIELQDVSLTVGTRVMSAPLKVPVWKTLSAVTIMGDAAHVMSPAGGVGAVAALNDAFELARTIEMEGVSSASISKFEQQMRDFAERLLQRTNTAGMQMLGVSLARD